MRNSKKQYPNNRNRILISELVSWAPLILVTCYLISLPVIADDFILILNFNSRWSDLNLPEAFIREVESQWSSSNERFLPVGWVLSSITLSFARFISQVFELNIGIGWSIARSCILVCALIISWKSITRILQTFGHKQIISLKQYLLILVFTLQLHALWGHDSIISYSSTIWFLIIFVFLYFYLLEVPWNFPRLLIRLLVLLLGLFTYEAFIGVLGYVIVRFFYLKDKTLRRILPDIVVLGIYVLFLISRVYINTPSYQGLQPGSIARLPLVLLNQLLSSLPFSTWPLYLYSLFTERTETSLFLFGLVTSIVIFFSIQRFKPLVDSTHSVNSNVAFIPIAGFFLILVCIFSYPLKYQAGYFLVPGFTYLQYSVGWVLSPFLIVALLNRFSFSKLRNGIILVTVINSFILTTSVIMINHKFESNARIIRYFEIGSSENRCELKRELENLIYPEDYSNEILEIYESKYPNLTKCP